MNPCILDSDILSEILKRKDRRVIQRAEIYFQHFGFFTFSIVSWYEIVRGLRAIGAITRLQALDEFVARS
jgi:tRNA(fMet)-specific endonuclease VapC